MVSYSEFSIKTANYVSCTTNLEECATWSVCRACGPHAACAMSTCSMPMLKQFDVEII